MQSEKSAWKDALCGGIASFLARMAIAPFDLAKIRLQLQSIPKDIKLEGANPTQKIRYKHLIHVFEQAYKEEGFKALWRGNYPASLLWIFYGGIQFSCHGAIKKIYYNYASDLENSYLQKVGMLWFSGGTSALVATVFTYPFDLTRTAFAAQGIPKVYPTLTSFVKVVYNTQGFLGFFTGLKPTLVNIYPYMGLNFAIHDILIDQLREDDNQNPKSIVQIIKKAGFDHGIAGSISGTVSKIVSYPLDTVKRRFQATIISTRDEKYGRIPTYDGVIHCIRTILKDEGFRALFAGFVPTVLKSAVSSAVIFASFDVIKKIVRN